MSTSNALTIDTLKNAEQRLECMVFRANLIDVAMRKLDHPPAVTVFCPESMKPHGWRKEYEDDGNFVSFSSLFAEVFIMARAVFPFFEGSRS